MATTISVKINKGQTYGQALTKAGVNNPTRLNYTFASWNTKADGTGETRLSSQVVVNSETIYAQWTINTRTVSFYSNGGSGSMASQSVAYGGNITLNPNAFYRSGYNFAGWATSPGGSVVYPNGATINNVTNNINLYAKWMQTSYTVSYPAMPMGVKDLKIYKNSVLQVSSPSSSGSFTAVWHDLIYATADGADSDWYPPTINISTTADNPTVVENNITITVTPNDKLTRNYIGSQDVSAGSRWQLVADYNAATALTVTCYVYDEGLEQYRNMDVAINAGAKLSASYLKTSYQLQYIVSVSPTKDNTYRYLV